MKLMLSFAAAAASSVCLAQSSYFLSAQPLNPFRGTTDVQITSVTPQSLAVGFCSIGSSDTSRHLAATFEMGEKESRSCFVGVSTEWSSEALGVSPKGMVVGRATTRAGAARLYRLFGDGSVKPLDVPQFTLGLSWLWADENSALVSAWSSRKGYQYYKAQSDMSSASIQIANDHIEELWTIPGFAAMHKRKGGMVNGNVVINNSYRSAQATVPRDYSPQLNIDSIIPSQYEYVGPCDSTDNGPEIFLRSRPGVGLQITLGPTKREMELPEGLILLHAFKPLNSPLMAIFKNRKTGWDSMYYYNGELRGDHQQRHNWISTTARGGAIMYGEFNWAESDLVSSPESPVFAFKPKKKGTTVKGNWDLATIKSV